MAINRDRRDQSFARSIIAEATRRYNATQNISKSAQIVSESDKVVKQSEYDKQLCNDTVLLDPRRI